MKASELKVGNYVYDTERKKYVKACLIDGTCGLINGKNEDLFEPIELKKIHLTKNGFEAIDDDDIVFEYSSNYGDVEVDFDETLGEVMEDMKGELVIYVNIETATMTLNKPIDYIHELQQAMDVCKIEKELMI